MKDDWAKESAKHGIGEEGMIHAAKMLKPYQIVHTKRFKEWFKM